MCCFVGRRRQARGVGRAGMRSVQKLHGKGKGRRPCLHVGFRGKQKKQPAGAHVMHAGESHAWGLTVLVQWTNAHEKAGHGPCAGKERTWPTGGPAIDGLLALACFGPDWPVWASFEGQVGLPKWAPK